MKLLLLLAALTATSLAKPQNWFSSWFETPTPGGHSWQDVLDIVKEMETKMDKKDAEMETKMAAETAVMKAEMEAKLAKKYTEIQAKLDKKDAEIEKKVESAVAEAVRDLPYEMVSVYKTFWSTPGTTITYDRFISDYNNSERPGGEEGTLDLSTGTFTCLTPGYYTVTYSGYSHLAPGEVIIIYLWVNGARVEESRYHEHASSDRGGYIFTQGSHSLILHLDLGDTLELRTGYFTGKISYFILNIALTAPDSLDSRTAEDHQDLDARTISAP